MRKEIMSMSNSEERGKGKSFSTWVCSNHEGETVSQRQVTYADIACTGVPICRECGEDMEFSSEQWGSELTATPDYSLKREVMTLYKVSIVEKSGEHCTFDFLIYADSKAKVWKMADDFMKNLYVIFALELAVEVIIQPITSKDDAGQCNIWIPTEACDELKALVINQKDETPKHDAEIRAYVKGNSSECLFCHSSDITGGSIQVDSNCARQSVTCGNCSASWNDIYTLTGIDTIEKGDMDVIVNA